MNRVRRATVITHRRPDEIATALTELRKAAAEAGVELCFDEEETRKHELDNGAGLALHAPVGCKADLCVVLGGDGTILQALRTYIGTGTPVFAVNFGEVGFLATVEPEEGGDAFRRALAGNFETMELPAIVVRRSAKSPPVQLSAAAMVAFCLSKSCATITSSGEPSREKMRSVNARSSPRSMSRNVAPACAAFSVHIRRWICTSPGEASTVVCTSG